MAWTAETDRVAAAIRASMAAQVDDAIDAEIWVDAWADLRDEWDALVARILADNDGWPGRGVIVREARTRAALAAVRTKLTDVVGESATTVIDTLPGLSMSAAEGTQRVTATMLPAGWVSSRWQRVDQAALDAIVKRATGQIHSLTKPIPADVEARMKSELVRGVAVGENPRTVAALIVARVGHAFDGGKSRMETIARTEMLDAYRAADAAARAANAQMISGWEWVATLDSRTCIACLERHGTRYTGDVTGPDGHQRCRCTSMPVTMPWAELGIDTVEPPSTLVTGEQWFLGQPVDVQRAIMGPSRLDLWQSGRVSWGGFGTVRSTPGWRDSVGIAPVSSLM